jgi:hypothetical protein
VRKAIATFVTPAKGLHSMLIVFGDSERVFLHQSFVKYLTIFGAPMSTIANTVPPSPVGGVERLA